MGIPINIPSLADLLAAYKTGSLTDGINAASSNFNATARTAADVQAQRAAAAAQQQQIQIQQQQANTAQAEQQSKIVSPEDYQAVTTGQAPSGPVNQTLLDSVMKQKAMVQEQANELANRKAIADQAVAERAQQAALANQAHEDQIKATAQTAANANLDTAAKLKVAAHSWLPWETPNEKTANTVYNAAASRAGVTSNDPVGDYLSQVGAKDTPANRKWAASKVGQ